MRAREERRVNSLKRTDTESYGSGRAQSVALSWLPLPRCLSRASVPAVQGPARWAPKPPCPRQLPRAHWPSCRAPQPSLLGLPAPAVASAQPAHHGLLLFSHLNFRQTQPARPPQLALPTPSKPGWAANRVGQVHTARGWCQGPGSPFPPSWLPGPGCSEARVHGNKKCPDVLLGWQGCSSGPAGWALPGTQSPFSGRTAPAQK